jgi:hypothetical protein
MARSGQEREPAYPSTALRFGRDDKGEGGYGPQQRTTDEKPQISPLRFAPVEMTKGRAVMARSSGQRMRNRRSLHYAALRSR